MITLLESMPDDGAEPGDFCLHPEQLAALLDGSLHLEESGALEAHLADCAHCLSQLALLSRVLAEQNPAAPPPHGLVARAAALCESNAGVTSVARRRWAMPLAAAAALCLALLLPWGHEPTPQGQADGALSPHTRYAAPLMNEPRLLQPVEGSVIRPLEQVFRWSEVPGALFYEVRLVSLDGDLLLRERIKNTRWLIPDGLHLNLGGEYFVRVDAYLSEAQYLSSGHSLFRVEGAQ